MSQFLMIVPDGWVEVQGAYDLILAWPGGETEVQMRIGLGEFVTVEGVIEGTGIIPPGKTVGNAMMFGSGEAIRLFVQFVDL